MFAQLKSDQKVIFRLNGGLGNQLFQICAAIFHKNIYNEFNVIIDTSLIKQNSTHGGFLITDCFDDKGLVNFEDIRRPLFYKYINYLNRVKCLKFLNKYFLIFNEVDFLDVKTQLRFKFKIFNGYWQDYKHLEDIKPLIMDNFRFKDSIVRRNSSSLKLIEKSPVSVSIHIRRGDYLNENSIHSVQNVDFYKNAISLMLDRVSRRDVIFFVFSDDIVWAKSNLLINESIILISTCSPVDDFYLMSNCQHHIISNSTFSWWAAWIGDQSSKIVISPRQWFKNESSPPFFLPPTWLLI